MAHGGMYSTTVVTADNRPVTHLITTAKHIEGQAKKVNEARKYPSINIVSFDWLRASITSHVRADEVQFSLTQPDLSGINARSSNDLMPSIQKETMGKRPRSATSIEDDPSDVEDHEVHVAAKRHKDVQTATSKSLVIPVDETCPLAATHRVYIGDDGMIYDAALNQTNAGSNNNKFYRVQILVSGSGDFRTWTRWGRVGEPGKGATLGDGSFQDALAVFAKKFKDKAGVPWCYRFDVPKGSRKKGYYTFVERKYEDDSDDGFDDPSVASNSGSSRTLGTVSPVKRVESALAKPVQRLMELIFNQQYFADTMRELDYDANKLPLGKLSKRTLERGFEILKDLGELLMDPVIADTKHNMTWPDAIAACSNAFYTIIPHAFGRSRPPVISSDEMLKKEINLMESLSDMQIANTIMADTAGDLAVNALDQQFAGLGLQEMTPLDPPSDEFKLLQEYLIKSHGHTHHLSFQVQDIFRIERNGEDERFEQSPYAKIQSSDRRLLWHGSRVTNYGGILSQGLRIAPPEAPVNGYAFGKGVYLADISSKSANYCQSHASNNTGLLLLCEVELGKPMLELEIGRSDAAELAKELGCIATWGRGATVPEGWKDASCVNSDLEGVNMEYIAYDVAQVRLRYLLRVEMTPSQFGY